MKRHINRLAATIVLAPVLVGCGTGNGTPERQATPAEVSELQELRQLKATLDAQAALARSRQPFLEKLATQLAESAYLKASCPPGVKDWRIDDGKLHSISRLEQYSAEAKQYYYHACLKTLAESNVVLIADEVEFRTQAAEATKRYLRRLVWPAKEYTSGAQQLDAIARGK